MLYRVASLLVAALFACVAGQGVGFKTTLSDSGLQYLEHVGLELMQKSLATVSIPSMQGIDGSPIGRIEWTLSDITMNDVTLNSPSITTVPGTGFTVKVQDLESVVTLFWDYKKVHWPHLADHGTADIVVGTYFAATLKVTVDAGRPKVHVVSTTINIGKLDIKVHGGPSWLYDFFINALHASIKAAVQSAIQGEIGPALEAGINKGLATLPVKVDVNKEMMINYEMTAQPVFTEKDITLNQLGEFLDPANPQNCPTPTCNFVDIPNKVDNGDMLQMIISDYVANSAGFVNYKQGKMKITIEDSEIPSYAPMRLNTTYWKYLIPGLYNEFPNNLMMAVVSGSQPPSIVFTPTGAVVNTVGDLEMFVIEQNNSVVPAFTLSGNAVAQGTASISGKLILGNLTDVTTNFTVASSNVGPFNAQILTQLMNLAFSQGIVPAINQYLQEGFALPVVEGLTFISPSLAWGNRYLSVSTNFHYAPSASDSSNDRSILIN